MKKSIIILGIALVAAVFLISDPAAWNCFRFIQPEYWARQSAEMTALYQVRTLDGQEVFMPVPPAQAIESLAGEGPAWRSAVRALLLEQLGRMNEAEQAWRDYIRVAERPAEGITCLAAFHHRHRQYRAEMELLESSVAVLTAGEKPALTAAEVWDRIVGLTADAGLDAAARSALERRRIAFFQGKPEEERYVRAWLEALLEDKRWTEFDAGLADYARRFPARPDQVFLLRARQTVARGDGGRLPVLFAEGDHPLMDPEVLRWIFGKMEELKQWKGVVGEAERRLRANPLDRDAVVRLYQAQVYKENLSAAAGLLKNYRLLKNARLGRDAAVTPWTPEELAVMGVLAARTNDSEEALRYFHSFYRDARPGQSFTVPGLTGALVREEALKSAFWLLVPGDAGVQRYHRESLDGLATLVSADTHPGLPMALLSLILNGTRPADELQALEKGAGPYFVAWRAEAAVIELKTCLPVDDYVQYRARLAPLYAAHGDRSGAVRLLEELGRAGVDPDLRRGFLLEAARYAQEAADWPSAERLLRQAVAVEAQGAAEPLSPPALLYWEPAAGGPRRTRWLALDALIAFLNGRQRPLDALAVYKDLIQKNPRQEDLYEKLAGFLENTGMGAEQLRLYQRAIQEFDQPGWFNRLARYYLRKKQAAEFQDLSRQVAARFAGSDLESYCNSVLSQGSSLLGDKPYRRFSLEIGQAALDRFPLNPRFLDMVLGQARRLDPPRYQRLLATYAMVSDRVRDLYFQDLSGRGLLQPLLDAEPPADDPLRVMLGAEARIWRCRFEEATPLYEKLAALYPGDAGVVDRCALLLQSGGAYRPESYTQAAGLLTAYGERTGQEAEYFTRAGDCLALGGRLADAGRLWRRILDLYPRDPEKWKDVATIFWDYYQFDDSLNLLQEVRRRAGDPDLYPFEVGALEEEAGRIDAAMAEYLKIAVTWDERHWEARSRLDQLLKKENNRAAFTRVVEEQLRGRDKPVDYLVGVREFLNDWNLADQFPLEKWAGLTLAAAPDAEAVRDALSRLQDLLGADEQLAAYRRLVDLAAPGVERLEAVFELAERLGGMGRTDEALALLGTTVKENPLNLGVIRRAVARYQAVGRDDLAAAALRGILPAAVAPYKRELTLRLLDVLAEEHQYAEAATVAASWVADNPKDFEMRDRQWAALSGQGRNAEAIQACQAALKQLPSLEPDPDRRRSRAAEIRERIITAALAQGDATQALDQYIELLKDQPEDRALLERAFVLATKAGKVDRLTAFCEKTVSASPSDYRWPLLLARLAMLEEDQAAAVIYYTQCRKVVPHRTDLAAESARPLEILGNWAELQKLYTDLSRLEYNAPEWLRQAAVAAWRGGRDDDARDLAKRYAETRGGEPAVQTLAQYDLFVEWHHEGWATDLALGLLRPDAPEETVIRELGWRNLLPVAARAGRLSEALDRALILFDAAIAAEDNDRIRAWSGLFRSNLPRLLNQDGRAEDREAVLRAVQPRLAGWLDGAQADPVQEAFLPGAKAGVMEEFLGPLLARQLPSGSSYMPWDIREYLTGRGLWAILADLYRRMADDTSLYADSRMELREQTAWLAMLQNRSADELRILQEMYQSKDGTPSEQAAWRYFELLSRENRLGDLGADFLGVRVRQGDFVEFLAVKGDYSQAAAALQKCFAARSGLWRQANLARLALASDGALPVDAPFQGVLRLVPAGRLLRTEADSSTQLLPPQWYGYAALYGAYRLAKGGAGSEPVLWPAELERNTHRRKEYEDLFERLLAAGALPQARPAAAWMKTMESRPVADAWARLRLAEAAGDAAELGTAYRAMLATLIEGNDANFVTEHGDEVLALGRRASLLAATAGEWSRLFARYHTVSRDSPLADLWRICLYSLPAGSRTAWLTEYLGRLDDPDPAAGFFADQGVLTADNFLPLAEALVQHLGEGSVAGREARLILLGKRWGAAPESAMLAVVAGETGGKGSPETEEEAPEMEEGESPAPQTGGFLAGSPLRVELESLDVRAWTQWKSWLEQQAGRPVKPTTDEVLAWAGGMPGGRDVWAGRQALLYEAWGLAAEARGLRRALLEAGLEGRLPTAEEAYTLGAWAAEDGNADAMVQRFYTALNRADDRAGMAKRIVEYLLDHRQAPLAEPFLVVLEGLDPGGPVPAELRLRRLLDSDPKLVSPDRILAFVDRPDAPIGRKLAVIEQVIQKGLQDRTWAGGVSKAAADAGGRPWAEARRLLAVRLQSLLAGAPAALPGVVADLGTHPDARNLAAWVVDRAQKAGQPQLCGRYLPVALRNREPDAPLLPWLPAALAGGLEKSFLSRVWTEALTYGYLNERTDPGYLQSVGNQLADRLAQDHAGAGDLAPAEALLDHLNLREADKERLAVRILELQPDLARQRKETAQRFRVDANVGQ
jgi:hypothetical protein